LSSLSILAPSGQVLAVSNHFGGVAVFRAAMWTFHCQALRVMRIQMPLEAVGGLGWMPHDSTLFFFLFPSLPIANPLVYLVISVFKIDSTSFHNYSYEAKPYHLV
jgi:hypothetical protein